MAPLRSPVYQLMEILEGGKHLKQTLNPGTPYQARGSYNSESFVSRAVFYILILVILTSTIPTYQCLFVKKKNKRKHHPRLPTIPITTLETTESKTADLEPHRRPHLAQILTQQRHGHSYIPTVHA